MKSLETDVKPNHEKHELAINNLQTTTTNQQIWLERYEQLV